MMETLFIAFSALALGGWIILIVTPGWEHGVKFGVGLIIPGILATAYLVLFPALYLQAPGGFGSLADLTRLLTFHPGIVLAAWLHYLAFDLLIGRMLLEDSRARGIPHAVMIIPLLLCFMFGPVGWLSYMFVKRTMSRRV